ncbi:MAG: acylphosphatase [Anaerolineae bacterium]
MEQLHAIVHGRVQGVNFRYYTLQEARKRGLVGWVRNRPDLTVEVRAEGPRDQLEQFLAFLHRGSPSANVTRVQAEWLPASGTFTTFEIRYGSSD